MCRLRWRPMSLIQFLVQHYIDEPWNMIWAGEAIEFRAHITCFADTHKIWNGTTSKTCLHTHSCNPRLIIPAPTLTSSFVSSEKLKLILPLQLVKILLLLLKLKASPIVCTNNIRLNQTSVFETPHFVCSTTSQNSEGLITSLWHH